MHAKFALYDYVGNAKKYYLVDCQVLDRDPEVSPDVAHHILVVDCSGSMYHDMPAMRTMVEKLLTLEEFHNSNMLVTLITYSGVGELTTHFSRKQIQDIMRPDSAEVAQIRQLHVIGLTCISQALIEARKHVRNGETTCISLHSDGYANDSSPATERRLIDAICAEMVETPNVFVNTVAYGPCVDFPLLVGVANALSGKCAQATSARDVYLALHDTTALLAGRMAPAIEVPLGEAGYQVFVSRSAKRVNGASTGMVLRGLKPEDDRTVYRLYPVDKQEYLHNDFPVCGGNASLEPVFAFAAAQLAEGHLCESKYTLMATRCIELIGRHYRALTTPALAAMHADLMAAITQPDSTRTYSNEYGLGMHRVPVIEVLEYLSEHARYLTVNITELKTRYKRRGLKMLQGHWDEDGKLVEPQTKTVILGEDIEWARMHSFEVNNSTASVNMLCSRHVNLLLDGRVVDEVAGIRFTGDNQLRTYNNYTIVGDGELCVEELHLRITDKAVFRQLRKWGLVEDQEFSPATTYCVRLDELPLVDFQREGSARGLGQVFHRLACAKILIYMMNALLPGKSARFTSEQVADLAKYHITGSLYYSPPMALPYRDRDQAIADGLIDYRPSYEIDLGTTQILSRDDLHSANECLARFFEPVGVTLTKGEKPKMPMWWYHNVRWQYKALSKRVQITPIDDLMKPIFSSFLGITTFDALDEAMADAQVSEQDRASMAQVVRGRFSDQDDVVELFTRIRAAALAASEALLKEHVHPLVFYIGASGLLPDGMGDAAWMLTAEQAKEKYPKLKIGKPHADSTFFVFEIDRVVLSVTPVAKWYSVDTRSDDGEVS